MRSVLQLTLAQRRELFVAAAQKLGYGAAVMEKDFWVCWTLRHLFALPGAGVYLVFKGGTSLSKAWGAIRRFSEDVDVSLSREWLGFGGAQDPERAPSKSKRKAQLEALKAASAAKIQTELVAGLRERFTADLGASGWEVKPDAKDDQSLVFSYSSRKPVIRIKRRCPAVSGCCLTAPALRNWSGITVRCGKCFSRSRPRGRRWSIGCAGWKMKSTEKRAVEARRKMSRWS